MRRDERLNGLRHEDKSTTSGQVGPKPEGHGNARLKHDPSGGAQAGPPEGHKRRQPDMRPADTPINHEPATSPAQGSTVAPAPEPPQGGPASRAHFEAEPPQAGPVSSDGGATSGQHGPKQVSGPRQGRRQQAHAQSPGPEPHDTPKHSPRRESSRQPPSDQSRRAEAFRQESEAPRPSDRLRHEDTGPEGGGGRGRSRAQRKLDKSKLKMEKAGDGLAKAEAKLAKQKPQKRPGPVKTLRRQVQGRAWNYAHLKVHQAENDNVGLEAAHKTELTGESALRGTSRFVRRRIRTRPARRVRKAQRRAVKAQTQFHMNKLAQEQPELVSNPLSRMLQKRKIKKQYAKQAREAAKRGAQAAKKTAVTTEKIAARIGRALFSFVKSHPIATLVIILILVLLLFIASVVSTIGTVGNGIVGAAGATSYLAEDAAIEAAELAYTEWETDLHRQAMSAEATHPGYDEYRYNVADISHNPYELMAFLTATQDDFTFAGVAGLLLTLFNEQYSLTFTPEVEIRYRTEERTGTYRDPDTLELVEYTYEVEVAYEWHILNVALTAQSFTAVVAGRMDMEQAQRYAVYMVTKGNRQYWQSPFGETNWLPYVTSYYGYRQHPTTGALDLHRGVDIALAEGTPILAAQDGTVTFAGYDGSYGYVVVLDDGAGLVSKYAHCSALLVSEGQAVTVGTPIATVGSTGQSTGPHLHFEVLKDGQYLNPLFFAVTNDYNAGPEYGEPGAPMGDGSYSALIAEAERHLGKPYVFGASGPDVFDCSGFVCYVLNASGVHPMGRTTAQGLYNLCTPIPASEAQPGDLIFFTGTYSTPNAVSHVGIYTGGGMMIHCGDPISYASVNNSYWQSHFYSYGRLP